jgi:hypothetical protein
VKNFVKNPIGQTKAFFKSCKGDAKGCITKIITAPLKLPIFQLAKGQLKAINKHFGDNKLSKGIAKAGAWAGNGITKWFEKMAPGDNVAAKIFKGIGGGLGRTVSGVADVVANPGAALSAILEVAEDPINSGHAIYQSIKAECKADAATCAGQIFTDIASLAIPAVGAAKIGVKVSQVAQVAKASKIAQVVTKAASAAGNAVKATKIGKATSKATTVSKAASAVSKAGSSLGSNALSGIKTAVGKVGSKFKKPPSTTPKTRPQLMRSKSVASIKDFAGAMGTKGKAIKAVVKNNGKVTAIGSLHLAKGNEFADRIGKAVQTYIKPANDAEAKVVEEE